MIIKYYLLLGFVLAVGWPIFSQDFRDAVQYNNFIINEQNKIISTSLEYMALSVHSEDHEAIEKQRKELINEINAGIRRVGKMPSFNGSNRLKNQTIDVFELYIQIYETDLVVMLGLKKKYQDSYEALEAYLKAEKDIDDKMKRALEQLSNAQESFANRNDIKFQTTTKSKLAYQVDQMNMLSNYSRRVFLEYFYVSWKFQDMIAVLHERNGRLLDRKREDVIETAEKALKNLKAIDRFRNEKEYMGQTVDLIEYFLSLSKREFARIAAIYKKDFLSESDADYINRVFNDYNANIQNLVYNWNMANQFLWKENIAY